MFCILLGIFSLIFSINMSKSFHSLTYSVERKNCFCNYAIMSAIKTTGYI